MYQILPGFGAFTAFVGSRPIPPAGRLLPRRLASEDLSPRSAGNRPNACEGFSHMFCGLELGVEDKVISLSVLDSVNINPKLAKDLLKNGSADKAKRSEIIAKQKYILSLTENGFGKRTSFYDYRVTNRGGKGIIGIINSERNGDVVSVKMVKDGDELVIISSSGMVTRMGVSALRKIGRNTQGVRMMSLNTDEVVVDVGQILAEDGDK